MAAGDTQITIVGNLVDDPELRFTPNGQAVAKFVHAQTGFDTDSKRTVRTGQAEVGLVGDQQVARLFRRRRSGLYHRHGQIGFLCSGQRTAENAP